MTLSHPLCPCLAILGTSVMQGTAVWWAHPLGLKAIPTFFKKKVPLRFFLLVFLRSNAMVFVRERFSVLPSMWLLMSSNFSGLLKRSRDGTVTSTPWGCLVQSRGIVGRTCGEVIANWRCWRRLKIANHIFCVLTFALRLDNCPTQIVNQLLPHVVCNSSS